MNKLEHLAEFQRLLANYHVSGASKRVLDTTKLVLLTAPTSAGRNTIIRELLKTDEYHFIISDTTRKPRINDGILEQNGVEYWFRSEEDVLNDLKAGKYLEAEILHLQQVSGISIRELKKASSQGKTAITDVDMLGVHNIIQAKADTIAILVLPPSFAEWQRRIKYRGEMDAEEHRRRMQTACKIFAAALKHNYFNFVINDKLGAAIEQVHQLAKFGKQDDEAQRYGRQLAQKLYNETEAFLGGG